MSDEDFSAAGAGTGRPTAPGKHRGPRFTWSPQFEATFFRSLCESVSLGLRDGSTFKPEAWERAVQALIDKHGAYANKSHLINKTDNARKKYRLWRGLREDPEFYYNAQTRTVTATDEAWARHLQKEPLARSLRARPFEHEEYYEILFPDVIGSGGAPKRLTKPRRKGTTENVNTTTEEPDAPGTAIMDLLADTAYINPNQTHIPPPMPPAMPAPMTHHQPQQQQQQQPPPQQQQQQQQQQQHNRAPANTMPPPPPRTSVSSASALTPPEENGLQTRKRMQGPDNNTASTGQPPDKRRRTAAPGYLDLTQQQQQQQHQQQQQQHQHQHQQHQAQNSSTAVAHPPTSSTQSTAMTPGNAGSSTTIVTALAETLQLLSEALRTSGSAGAGGPVRGGKWQEQAMDIFFRDFVGEDMDLQLKIAEKVLTDENKAMVFCKMPDALRRHWVKRLREVHNRIA